MDQLEGKDAKALLALETETMVKAVERLHEAIECQTKQEYDKMREKAQEVVQLEKFVDRIKDAIVERMFGRDRLPFSKGDRFGVVNQIDHITDMAEIVARKMVFVDIIIPEEIRAEYLLMSEKTLAAVRALQGAINNLGSDLMKAKNLCKKVEDERRIVRDTEWGLFPKIYKLKPPKTDLLLLKDLIEGIGRLADRAEDFGDKITALAVKYITIR